MKIISGVYWDKGGRENNQDSLIFEQVLTRKGRVVLAAVSDGIGGLSEGEIAGGFILEKLKECFYQELLPMLVKGRGKRVLKRCFFRCSFVVNDSLKKYADSKEIKLGATVSVLLIWKRKYMAVHLGDSRISILRGRRWIMQITRDHRRGQNTLTKCMGSFEYQQPDIYSGRVRPRTGFLLCTDGFYHYPGKQLLTELLNPGEQENEMQIRKRLKELAVYGLRQGEQDNMSAIYLVCR